MGKGRVIIILLLFITAGLKGQFYEYGQDAGKLKWHQFSTPNYRVIYPRGVDSLAKEFANRLEYFYPHLGSPLNHRHSPMPVIIHNESSFSNGVFVWAPKRLEIFTNPDPNGYNQDWLTQLALHEGRHAVQIDKLNQGFTRVLGFAGGEQAVGAMAVFLPYWYLEGDAVDAETRLSNSGRGRQPSFEMGFKAQLLEEGKMHTFSKSTMGSYKDYVPNHYKLGYLMVRHGRRKYGDNFWIDFQQYAARKPYLFNPTFFSMRKYGLKNKSQFYKEALGSYRDHWKKTATDRELTPFDDWNPVRNRHYTSYTFPQYVSPSMLLTYKSGMDQIPEFIFLGKKGEEQRIYRPGFLSTDRISYSGNHLVWDEFIPDKRWTNRNYSVIKTYELGTGIVKTLGNKTRYYSPCISKDGTQIAAVEQTELQQFNLVIITMDGNVEHIAPSPQKMFIQQPAWMEADSALVVLTSGESGKSLFSYVPESKKWKKLFDAGFDNISYPVVHDHRIYFSGTFSGIDNIYCHDMLSGQIYQVTSARFGAFYPQISEDGKHLIYSDYSAKGYGVATLSLEQGIWKPLEEIRNHTEQLDYKQTEQEKNIIRDAHKSDTTAYVPRKYNKALHLFNFHSWLPLYFDYLNPNISLNPDQLPVSPGLSLISQNRLSTAVSQLGYEYKDGYHMFHSGIQLKGKYPVMNLYFDYGGEPDLLLLAEENTVISLPNDMRFTAQTYVPLRLNTGKYISFIQPGIEYNYRRDVQYVESENRYKTNAHYLYYTFNASVYLRKGLREILPRIGFSAMAGFYHVPFNHQVFGSVSRARFTAYLPGILKHQTIKVAFNYQKQYDLDEENPAYINLMDLPRGLHGVFGEVLSRYSVDYVLPLLYPDLEISSLLYVKRIRGALWADHMKGTNIIMREPQPYIENQDYTSIGIDLVADINLMRISFPISVGGRIIYQPGSGNFRVEWIYSIDIN